MFAPRLRIGSGAAVPRKCRMILSERHVILVTRSRGRQGCCPYNRWMLQQLSGWVGPLLIERLTLALNHVLASEAQAVERLKPHAGRVLQVLPKGLPALLQAPEFLAFRITPAGLLEALEADAPATGDLRIEMDLSNPARLIEAAVSGQRPAVSIQGDARLATDIGWLMDHVRWDYEDDLARVLGPMPAHQIAQVVRMGAAAMRQGLAALARLMPERPAS